MALVEINTVRRDVLRQEATYLINTERIVSYYYDSSVNDGNGGVVIHYEKVRGSKYDIVVFETSNSLADFSDMGNYDRLYKYVDFPVTARGVTDEPLSRTMYIDINHVVLVYDIDGSNSYIEVENGLFDVEMYKVSQSISTIKSNVNVTFAKSMFENSAAFEVHNSASFSFSFTDADTYYLLDNANLYLGTSKNFSFSNGIIQYDSTHKARINLDGAADIEASDKHSTITLAIFKNESVVSDEITPTDFTSLDRLKNVSITAIMDINEGDQLSVRAKSNEASNSLNVVSFHFSGKGYFIE